MAGTTYVTKAYSTYTNIPGQHGTYDHNPKHSSNQYVVESKTNERVRAPAAGYTDFHGNGSPSKVELLKEYVHSPTMSGKPKYAPKNLYDDYEPSYGRSYENSSPPISPDKQAHGYFSEDSNRIRSGPGYVRTGNVSSPLATHHPLTTPTSHPLTTPTNNINEALGMLEESVYYSPRADPRRRGVLDDLSTRAQPLEPQRRYARPAFVANTNDPRNYFSNTGGTINSHEAMRRYRGSLVP